MRRLLKWCTLKLCTCCKVILCNHHSREELVFESYPIHWVLCCLFLFRSLTQVISTPIMLLIGKCCVAVLKCETTFLLLTTLLPVNIYLVIIWRKESTHTLCLQRHIEQIVLTKCIVQGKCLPLSCHSSQRNSRICHI